MLLGSAPRAAGTSTGIGGRLKATHKTAFLHPGICFGQRREMRGNANQFIEKPSMRGILASLHSGVEFGARLATFGAGMFSRWGKGRVDSQGTFDG